MVEKTILGYHVDEKIGSGGFGTVYKVSKTNAAGTYVRALKHITLPTKKQYTGILNSMGGDYSKADNYFASILNDIVSEISILSTLSESGTQNIVRYYENDIVETPSPKTYDIYILMEFLTPFTNHVENNSFSVRDVIALGKDILKALMACHEKNIIHRDIKDDNIFVSTDGVYKLGDFGVSKALKDKSRAESVKGTPNFIAPEVYLGKEKYDHTVDLYSLGIVLYKLLNKTRNPFLPKYPDPYSSQDEDVAFEARMTGHIPELPICAENELGKAVLKAIMPRKDRYNTATEFYEALQNAESELSEEELSKDLGLDVPKELRESGTSSQAFSADIHDDETVGSDILNQADKTVYAKNDNNLSETMFSKSDDNLSETMVSKVEEENPPTMPTNERNYENFSESNDAAASWEPYTPPPTPSAVTSPKKNFKWLLYLSPLLIAAVWLTVYLILIPTVYGKAVSFIEWFIGNPAAIVDAIKDASNVLTPIYMVILLMIYNWLTVAGLVVSFFFIGRSIQNKRPEQSNRAKLHGKQPYTITIELLEEIKLIENSDAEQAKKAVYSLNERLKNESAFGEGSDAVIDCENEIASYLNAIQGSIPGLRNENTAAETARNIEGLCQRCQAKLKSRIELKKR